MDEQKQIQQSQMMQPALIPAVNRSLSNNADNSRLTPDGLSRIPHPSARGVAKSVSPSPVSYSVSHQPHSHPNYNMPSSGRPVPGPYYGSMGQNAPMGNVGGMKNDLNNSATMQRTRMPMTQGSNQSFQQNFPNMVPRPINPSIDQSKALQLKELARKQGSGMLWLIIISFLK